jgi:peptidyl-prolyl cis-trans isomerase A (cyclophilin A)
MNLKHALLASTAAAALAGAAIAQQSTPTTPASSLPDGPEPTAAAMLHPNGPMVVMDTSMGRISCQFFQRQAPTAVANFIGLANGSKDFTDPATNRKVHGKRFYDGTTFHRVIAEFMIQGGDPTGTGMGDPGYSFNDELDPNLNFDVPGRMAMANSGPNTNGSQFFICNSDCQQKLAPSYNHFGYVVEGLDVVKQLRQGDKMVTLTVEEREA